MSTRRFKSIAERSTINPHGRFVSPLTRGCPIGSCCTGAVPIPDFAPLCIPFSSSRHPSSRLYHFFIESVVVRVQPGMKTQSTMYVTSCFQGRRFTVAIISLIHIGCLLTYNPRFFLHAFLLRFKTWLSVLWPWMVHGQMP